jgi:hypothetical protein
MSGRRYKVHYRKDGAAPAVPFLRLSGRWLLRHGFRIGDRFRVIALQGELVLVREEDDGDQDLPPARGRATLRTSSAATGASPSTAGASSSAAA